MLLEFYENFARVVTEISLLPGLLGRCLVGSLKNHQICYVHAVEFGVKAQGLKPGRTAICFDPQLTLYLHLQNTTADETPRNKGLDTPPPKLLHK